MSRYQTVGIRLEPGLDGHAFLPSRRTSKRCGVSYVGFRLAGPVGGEAIRVPLHGHLRVRGAAATRYPSASRRKWSP